MTHFPDWKSKGTKKTSSWASHEVDLFGMWEQNKDGWFGIQGWNEWDLFKMKNQSTSKLKIHGKQSDVKEYLNHESSCLVEWHAYAHISVSCFALRWCRGQCADREKSCSHLLRVTVTLPRNHKGIIVVVLPDVETKAEEKLLNFLTPYSPMSSPWNRQSDLPLGTQLPRCWYSAEGKKQR